MVLSDLSPNLSGIPNVDQARSFELAEGAVELCRKMLKPDGVFVIKAFHGEAFDALVEAPEAAFAKVKVVKPSASRGESAETYVVARGARPVRWIFAARSNALNNMLKNLVIWLVIGLVLMTVFNQFNTRQSAQAPMEYSQFLEVKAGRISKVTIEGRQLKATTSEGKRVTSYSPGDIWLVSDLLKYGVKIEAKPEEPSLLMNIFVSWFPMLLLIGVWIFFMRQMQGGGRGGAFVRQVARAHA